MGVQGDPQWYRGVHRGTSLRGLTAVQGGPQWYKGTHSGTRGSTGVQRDPQGYKGIHSGTRGSTAVQGDPQRYKGVHSSTRGSTVVYWLGVCTGNLGLSCHKQAYLSIMHRDLQQPYMFQDHKIFLLWPGMGMNEQNNFTNYVPDRVYNSMNLSVGISSQYIIVTRLSVGGVSGWSSWRSAPSASECCCVAQVAAAGFDRRSNSTPALSVPPVQCMHL